MNASNWVCFRLDPEEVAPVVKDTARVLASFPTGYRTSTQIRKHWETELLAGGWIRSFAVGRSTLSIGYVRQQIGMCIQMGNTCRVYADLLKLETVFRLGDIQKAILAVPSDALSSALGTNYASMSRAEKDITALAPTISMPIVLLEIPSFRRTS